MTGLELIDSVAEATGKTKADVATIINKALLTIATVSLKGEDKVAIRGFGIFSQKVIKPRKSNIDGTMSSGRTTFKFKPSK